MNGMLQSSLPLFDTEKYVEYLVFYKKGDCGFSFNYSYTDIKEAEKCAEEVDGVVLQVSCVRGIKELFLEVLK